MCVSSVTAYITPHGGSKVFFLNSVPTEQIKLSDTDVEKQHMEVTSVALIPCAIQNTYIYRIYLKVCFDLKQTSITPSGIKDS